MQRSRRDKIKLSRQQLHREDVTTRSGCRDNNCTSNLSQPHKAYDKNCDKACDNICILGQFAKVQQEMPQNQGPTSEPYKYVAAREETQLGGDLKEKSGLLKAPVFLFFFSFLLFSVFF